MSLGDEVFKTSLKTRKYICKRCRRTPFYKKKRFCLRCYIIQIFRGKPTQRPEPSPKPIPKVKSSSKVSTEEDSLMSITEGKTGEKVVRPGRYHCHRCGHSRYYSVGEFFQICSCGGFSANYQVVWEYSKYQYGEPSDLTHCLGCGCSRADAPGFYGSGHSKAGYCYDCGDS